MQVENECPPEPGSASAMHLPSGGNGSVGMKERVAALGVFVPAHGFGWVPGVGGDPGVGPSGVVVGCGWVGERAVPRAPGRGCAPALTHPQRKNPPWGWPARRQPAVRRTGAMPDRRVVRAVSISGPRYQSPVWSSA